MTKVKVSLTLDADVVEALEKTVAAQRTSRLKISRSSLVNAVLAEKVIGQIRDIHEDAEVMTEPESEWR
jgi:hypothetical protein